MSESLPTRRRWYQFGLRTMFVVVTVVAIGVWRFEERKRGNEWVVIGSVRGLPKYSNAIRNDLGSSGIECDFHGSKGYNIFVHRRDSKLARAILSDAMAANRYKIYFYDEDYDAY